MYLALDCGVLCSPDSKQEANELFKIKSAFPSFPLKSGEDSGIIFTSLSKTLLRKFCQLLDHFFFSFLFGGKDMRPNFALLYTRMNL